MEVGALQATRKVERKITERPKPLLTTFAYELLNEIFTHLLPRQLATIRLVCHDWNLIIKCAWFWKQLVLNHWPHLVTHTPRALPDIAHPDRRPMIEWNQHLHRLKDTERQKYHFRTQVYQIRWKEIRISPLAPSHPNYFLPLRDSLLYASTDGHVDVLDLRTYTLRASFFGANGLTIPIGMSGTRLVAMQEDGAIVMWEGGKLMCNHGFDMGLTDSRNVERCGVERDWIVYKLIDHSAIHTYHIRNLSAGTSFLTNSPEFCLIEKSPFLLAYIKSDEKFDHVMLANPVSGAVQAVAQNLKKDHYHVCSMGASLFIQERSQISVFDCQKMRMIKSFPIEHGGHKERQILRLHVVGLLAMVVYDNNIIRGWDLTTGQLAGEIPDFVTARPEERYTIFTNQNRLIGIPMHPQDKKIKFANLARRNYALCERIYA